MEIPYGNYLISVEGGKRLIDQTPKDMLELLTEVNNLRDEIT